MTTQTEMFERSKQLVPGGVHSPVRSFKGLESTPRFIARGDGAKIWDTDGKDYIDFCMSFGPLILGHRNPGVEQELKEALERGWSYGACEPYSLQLLEFLLERLPFVDQMRFVNSGTEAVMTALRLARGVTGKSKIIKFNGCYHGHVDSMLIKAGSGLAGTAEASSAGVPKGTAEDTLILELGDLEEVKACFNDHKDQIAAIIVEPLPANNGLLIQEQSYLEGLREITKANGALLIFDEVISGFRVAFGGMAEKTGITPDIVTYGKIIGGGLPVGALAAKKEIMNHLAPIGNVYQAGTL
ncbi:MAG: aminotransferase class III-fold pyridoxal phosphate-dependent enzyme, partial [Deltaproteobacteria bacterium]